MCAVRGQGGICAKVWIIVKIENKQNYLRIKSEKDFWYRLKDSTPTLALSMCLKLKEKSSNYIQ